MRELTINQRVRRLEIFLESKQDQEKLLNFLGKEYYDKYVLIKDKINDPEYKDVYKLIKHDPDEVKNFIDSFKSKSSIRSANKEVGADLIYNQGGWKVYRITTYSAAQIYGRNTKWCITGNYSGHEERGEEYFYDYINDFKLDGGYYFYIKSNNEKYCLLRTKSGEVASIWNIEDDKVISDSPTPDEVDSALPDDFPSIENVFNFNSYKARALVRAGVSENIKLAVKLDPSCIEDTDEYGYTPLSEAISLSTSRWVEPIKTLLQCGADPEVIMPNEDQTMLQFICDIDQSNSTVAIANSLIEAGADVNIKNDSGFTPLHFAASHDSDKLVKLLIEAGADVNSEDIDGDTPLHCAAVSNSVSSAIVLINNGANINAVNGLDETPLDLANEYDNERVVLLLES